METARKGEGLGEGQAGTNWEKRGWEVGKKGLGTRINGKGE